MRFSYFVKWTQKSLQLETDNTVTHFLVKLIFSVKSLLGYGVQGKRQNWGKTYALFYLGVLRLLFLQSMLK